MALIGEWARRVRYLFRRGAAQDELRREMEAHRAMMDDPRAFGNMLRLREDAGQTWGWRWLEDLWIDTRFAWRTLRHSPGFALTVVLTLAIGIGVNTAMFTLVDGLLLAPLYEDAGDIVAVRQRSTQPGGPGRQISYPNFVDLREGTASVFSDLAAASTDFDGIDGSSAGPSRWAAHSRSKRSWTRRRSRLSASRSGSSGVATRPFSASQFA
jgi:hypothetical protein